MRLTNEHNLPDVIMRALRNDKYSKGEADFSATEILDPPRVVLLKRRHWDELETDASDEIWKLLGSAVHAIIERADPTNALQEERMYVEVAGKVLSGKPDLLDNTGKLSDFKITSVYTGMGGSRLREWEEQLNIYAYMYRVHGFEVNALEIIALYRDWSKSKAGYEKDYPATQVEVFPIPLWSQEDQLKFIESRIQDLLDSEARADDDLPYCSAEETWEKPTRYAVKKVGNKTAIRVYDTLEAAETHVANAKEQRLTIEVRPGVRPRCQSYCLVAKFCNQYRDWQINVQATEQINKGGNIDE